MEEIKLANDKLERGSYAKTLFRIIAEYAPKRVYEITGFEKLSDVPDEEEDKEAELPAEGLTKVQIKELVQQSDKPTVADRQATDDFANRMNHLEHGAFIIAVSGPWGSGKTTFARDLFQPFLYGEGIVQGKDRFIIEHAFDKKDVFYFDAWKNDFYDDPLLPLSRLLIKEVCTDDEDKKNIAEALDEYVMALRHPVHMKEPIYYDTHPISYLMEEKEPLETRIDHVKNILQKIVQTDGDQQRKQQKAVIIIDELDRCKPTFAIKLLEIVKHLFNVKGLVFLFALDMIQLQHCIKTVYGNDFDAIGYLERFFDYTTYLPAGDRRQLFDAYAKDYSLAKETENANDYYDLCQQFKLTAREIKAACAAFHYLNRFELEKYPEQARKLYFYLWLLKFKCPEEVQSLDADPDRREERSIFFKAHVPVFIKEKTEKQSFIAAMSENKRIVDSDIRSLSGILFAEDKDKNAVGKHLLDYLFRKVEMYDSQGFDSKTLLEIEGIQRGTTVKMGHWPKDSAEPIEWIVLERRGSEALLLSKKGLDCKKYNNEFTETTWAECSLHSWLNNEFYKNAFDDKEQKKVLEKTIETPDNYKYGTPGGGKTLDHVFLLSIEEVEEYLKTREDRICFATRHAIRQGVKTSSESYEEWKKRKENGTRDEDLVELERGSCWWWLRSPGLNPTDAADVLRAGSLYRNGINVNYVDVAVRPAFWLNLES